MSQKVKREARRVAAAFGVQELKIENVQFCGKTRENVSVLFTLDSSGELKGLSLDDIDGDTNEYAQVHRERGWSIYCEHDFLRGLMARGLYRLGFEDESILSQLPPLSGHEKMELRLSLPREFWPKRWLDVED